MANHAQALGMDEVARDMTSSADAAKQADQKPTPLAEHILQA